MSLHPLETPLNTILLLSIANSLYRIIWPSTSLPEKLPTQHSEAYNWMPEKHPETTVFRIYTPKTLYPFSGVNGGRILLAIDRNVFDVTAGRNFYGPGNLKIVTEIHSRLLISYSEQRVCTATLQDGMRQEGWLSNRLTLVSASQRMHFCS
jgi:hypothetical protein